LTKIGTGTATLTGANNFNGATTVSAGTLNLNRSSGSAAGSTTSISVANNAKLLISQSNQINDSATVSLSGGTIQLASGVTETFAALSLSQASTLDFGSGTTGNLSLGSYEGGTSVPDAMLTINNFAPGNSFTFVNSAFAANGSNIGNYFTFGTGFVNRSITDNTGGSFTITAIPEPSTYAAAAGLLAMFLWPVRRRLVKDVKSVLGLRPTGRA
jgi:autotransporter-associated beta strand protein